MLRLFDADPRSRMPGGASRLWVVVICAVVLAGTALPMLMSSDTADPVDSAASAEVAQFAAAEEAVTRAEAATSRVIDSGLVLVRAGSPGVLRFDHFQALQAGMAAPLTCNASHPGNGIGTKYPEERMFGEWRYTESKMVAAQNACMAQLVQGKFIKRVDANLVLDVAFWVFQEGTAVNWVGGGSDSRTYLNGGGRDFRVNPDGSISLVNHPHLALGVCGPNDCYSDADVFFIFVVVPLAVALIGTLGGVYGCYRCKCCCFEGRRKPPRPMTQPALALPAAALPVIPTAQLIMAQQTQGVAKAV